MKEAELHISDAVLAMGSKKYKDAFECFQQAAELGCPRGYWGKGRFLCQRTIGFVGLQKHINSGYAFAERCV